MECRIVSRANCLVPCNLVLSILFTALKVLFYENASDAGVNRFLFLEEKSTEFDAAQVQNSMRKWLVVLSTSSQNTGCFCHRKQLFTICSVTTQPLQTQRNMKWPENIRKYLCLSKIFRRGLPVLYKPLNSETKLTDILHPKSWFIFCALDPIYNWLIEPLSLWPNFDSVQKAKHLIMPLRL